MPPTWIFGKRAFLNGLLGQTWLIAEGIAVQTLNAVIYDEGVFVAAGDDGGIVTSPDGFEWTLRHTGGGLNLHLLVHQNGTFIAYGYVTSVLTSTNGFDWVSETHSAGRFLRAVAAGQGLFSGVGEDHLAHYWAYPDYVWHSLLKATRSRLLAIAYGNGVFAAVGEGGTIEMGDGSPTTTIPWREIWCGEWPWSGEDLSTVMRPPDHAWWPARFQLGGTNGGLYTAETNSTWPYTQLPYWWGNRGAISGIASRSNLAVAVDTRGLVLLSTSNQGWSSTDPGFGPLRGIACGRDRFIAVGDAGTVIASTTGTNWTKLDGATQTNLWSIAFVNDQFVAVGEKTVVTSPDGLSWAAHSADANLRGVTFKHGFYAAVGLEGKVLTSTNAVEWISQPSGTTNDLYAISSDAHQFVAVGNNATILTARDGTNWTSRTSPRKVALRGVAFGDGTFVAVGERWTVLESDLIPQGPYLAASIDGGRLRLSIEDIDPGQFEIQISADLTAWSTWTNVTAIESRVLVIDPDFTQTGHRFYRAVVK